jgi:hypothetical protein
MAGVLSLMMDNSGTTAEKPKGARLSSDATFDYTLTAQAYDRDTSAATFRFNNVNNYSSLVGRFTAGFYTFSVSTVDTSADTVIVEIWSGSSNSNFSDSLIYTKTVVPVDSVYQIFDLNLTDSVYWEYVYFKVITNVSDATPEDSTATYKVAVELFAR